MKANLLVIYLTRMNLSNIRTLANRLPGDRFRAIAASLALLFIGVCGVAVHSIRKRARVEGLLEVASISEAERDWGEAEMSLRRCLSCRPQDAALAFRIGNTICAGAEGDLDLARSLPFFAKAFRLSPEEKAYRITFAERLIATQPREAIRLVSNVLVANPNDQEARRVRALGMARMLPRDAASDASVFDAWTALLDAHESDPGDIGLAKEIAAIGQRYTDALARKQGKTRGEVILQVAKRIDDLVSNSRDEADARVFRHLFRRRNFLGSVDTEAFCEDIDALQRLRPDSNFVRLLSVGMDLRTAQDPASDPTAYAEAVAKGKNTLATAVASDPSDLAAALTLAQFHWWSSNHRDAAVVLQDALANVPESELLRIRLAETALAARQWSLAKDALETFSSADSESADTSISSSLSFVARMLWAQFYLDPENPERDAVSALSFVDQLEPGHLDPVQDSLKRYVRGLCWSTLDQWSAAADEFEQANRGGLRSLPVVALAYARSRQGRYRDACNLYQQALTRVGKGGESINVAQIWIELARCHAAEQAEKLPHEQRWRAFDEALGKLDTLIPDSYIGLFLELDAMSLGRPPKVERGREKLIAQGLERHGRDASFHRLLAQHYLRTNQLDDASTTANRYEEILGRRDLRLRIAIAAAKGDTVSLENIARTEAATDLPDLAIQRARVHFRLGNYGEAQRILERRIADHPSDLVAVFTLSQIAWRLGDRKALLATLPRLQHAGAEYGCWKQLTSLQADFLEFLESGDDHLVQRLRVESQQIAEDFPYDRACRVLESLVAEKLGDRQRAIEALRVAIDCGANDNSVLLRLATLLKDSRRPEEAIKYCLLASRTTSDCKAAILAAQILASREFGESESRRAEVLFERIVQDRNRPGYFLFLMNLAVLREHQGQTEEAIALTREALQIHPESIPLKNNLAWFLTAYTEDHAEAGLLIKGAIDQVGPNPVLLDTHGMVLLAQGRTTEAIRELEQCLEADDVPASRYLHLAEAYHQADRTTAASRMLAKAERGNLLEWCPRDQRAFRKLKVSLP